MAIDINPRMTAKGYIRRSAEELQEAIIKKIKERIPSFEKLPYDVQSNLIDTAVAKLAQYENMLDVMFNAYSLDGSNEFFFKQMGEELGLRMKNAYNSQVTLRFKGLPGDIIPLHTIVQDSSKQHKFETMKRVVIGTTGEVDVLAYGESESIIPAGELTFLVSILSDGIAVTNPQASLAKINEETFEEFKFRAQARLRSPRMGGRLYAETCLKSIEGIDPRLISFYARDYTREYDVSNPELNLDETEENKPIPPAEKPNGIIPESVVRLVKLINEGQTRPNITTLQQYVDSKYTLDVNVQEKEFVHLYNKDNPNNYIYYNTRWYEVKFRRPGNMSIVEGYGRGQNILAENYEVIPETGNTQLYFCKSPGNRIGFYENRNSKLTLLFGPQVDIDESNKPDIKNYIRITGIESVVGGGDDYEVALALYQSFFETQKLLSNPSDNNKDRRKKITLGLYNNTFPVAFTRPKLIELNLKFKISAFKKSVSSLSVKNATKEYLEKAINSLKVGSDITINQLNQIIMPGLIDIDIQPVEVKTMGWEYDIGNFKDKEDGQKPNWKDFDIDNKIPEIEFDCYCILVRYEVNVVG